MSQMFDTLGNQNNQQQANLIQQIKNDPVEFLRNRGYSIPDGINTNDPNAIIDSLMRSGQIGNARMQHAMQFMNRFSRR